MDGRCSLVVVTVWAMQFVCPICASTNWREVVVPKGTGYYKTAFAECCGCTAMFRRPDLFTVGRGRISKDAAIPGSDPKGQAE